MLNLVAATPLRKLCVVLLSGSLMILTGQNTASAKGAGPIGLWAASSRYVLTADKSLPGLVLVDLEAGVAVERLLMKGAKVKGIASCRECDFALISGARGEYWRLQFSGTVSQMLKENGNLSLGSARLEPLELAHQEGKLTDGRMVLLGSDGTTAFVASSDDHAVYRVDFAAKPQASPLVQDNNVKPFGLNWSKNGDLLVSMHKREIWRVTVEGEILETYDIKVADCPGANELKPNLRAAVDDPLNERALLILATNPKSYDAVVWRLQVDERGKQSCTIAAGKIGRGPGWRDDSGEAVEFSRPHYFVPRPDTLPFQLIISDIDNRALRFLDLATDTTTTVMYDRDRRWQTLPAARRTSEMSCEQQNWANSASSFTPAGKRSCARPPKADALELTLPEAKAHCMAAGARLCEPAELRRAGIGSGLIAWTNADCASCWQRNAGESCAPTINTHKTPGIVHGDSSFSQSWYSGQALEIGALLKNGPATLCRPAGGQLKAAAPCCADEA